MPLYSQAWALPGQAESAVRDEWAGVCQGQSQGWRLNLTSNPATLSVSSDPSR